MIQSVEIAICTWNRADLLASTLDSLTRIRIPPGLEWRVLAVDNSSTDDTSEVLDEYSEILPIVSLHESQQGHTFARNRAIQESRADLILWTDDDVQVAEDWVTNYVDAANQQVDFDFWGGRIEPLFLEGQPAWIRENWSALAGCFAERNLGDQPLEFDEKRLPYGANFAIRGDVQRCYLFDANLGRRGHSVLGEDELDLFRRLLRDSYKGRWVPTSHVRHVITADRSTPQFVRDYFVGQGIALVSKGEAWNMPAWKIRWAYLWHSLAFEITQHFCASPRWFAHLARAGLAAGQWQALQGHSLRP